MSKDIDNATVKGCSELVAAFAIALLICFVITCCVGCKPHKEVVTEYVEQPVVVTQEHHTESVRVDIVRDTIHQRDSIYHYIKGDTVRIEKWHYLQGTTNVVRVDTLHVYDSVPYPVRVDVEKFITNTVEVEKPLRWWQKTLMGIGGLALIAVGIMTAYKMGKRK